ncbi:hypothetical protein CI1B_62420 [Bradyrhizobium ivorense]|uniref:Uncharacterized protein n=1 Tax=Bradyrhizobium ivorense TaxID=2511166 RepID=A0A508TP08_9BRAD|nr:hypothetical protein CI1B_62420 [Bradyrhizobium ivorense]
MPDRFCNIYCTPSLITRRFSSSTATTHLHPLCSGEQSDLPFSRGGKSPLPVGAFANQFFRRYPVLKIHATMNMQTTRKPTVMPRLTATLTSAISKKLQRKPEIR